MDGQDSPTGTPRKALCRSASWSVRSSPTQRNTNPSRPPPRPRPSLPPLQPLSIVRPPVLQAWPRPGSDDSGEWPHHPSTPAHRFDLHECSRVADHLYLGSDAVARDRESLRRHGITHVLNCVGYTCSEYFKPELAYKTLWLQDSAAEDITSVLYDVFDYFEDVRAARGRVLVHCSRGASRSASLVIAYLMWRHAQPFDDALRRVRAARGVTDPNLGFASQLLQCQKRVNAAPPSPGSSSLRVYRMAPHSPYDPLHLVPKALDRPGPDGLDTRGAFVVHVPSAIYVWVGRECDLAMAGRARAAACQLVRYERAQGPIVAVDEGSEPSDFWEALVDPAVVTGAPLRVRRRAEAYDLDFEIYQRALKGGVVPPFPLTGSATRLPAKESGWSRLRQRFLKGSVRGFVTAAAAACCDVSDKEDEAQPFRSPGSFSRDSLPTPSSLDSSSTLSIFSPASSSSDWYNSSPGSEMSNPEPALLSRLPLPMGKKGSSPSRCFPSLAERRGETTPSLVFVPLADDNHMQVSRDVVRDWSLSPSPLGEEEEDRMMDIELPVPSHTDQVSKGEGRFRRDADRNQLSEPVPHPGVLCSEQTIRKEEEPQKIQNHLSHFAVQKKVSKVE